MHTHTSFFHFTLCFKRPGCSGRKVLIRVAGPQPVLFSAVRWPISSGGFGWWGHPAMLAFPSAPLSNGETCNMRELHLCGPFRVGEKLLTVDWLGSWHLEDWLEDNESDSGWKWWKYLLSSLVSACVSVMESIQMDETIYGWLIVLNSQRGGFCRTLQILLRNSNVSCFCVGPYFLKRLIRIIAGITSLWNSFCLSFAVAKWQVLRVDSIFKCKTVYKNTQLLAMCKWIWKLFSKVSVLYIQSWMSVKSTL